MCCVVRHAPVHSLQCFVALVLAAVVLQGCGGSGSEEQRVDQFFKESKLKRDPVAKFAGKVSVDGQPPGQDVHLFVILTDPQHLQKSAKTPPLHAECDAQGNFAFTTYLTDDGVPYGKYVVTFVELHHGREGGRGRTPGLMQQFVGPDELKNLYNDPEKNLQDTQFVVEVKDSGRSDYEFNLTVAGKDPVKTPSPYAVTSIRG